MASKLIGLPTKIKLYNAAVVSLFTYGCEGWVLSPKLTRKLNGANSRLLAHFTVKTVQEEARTATTTLNLIKEIRKRRLCWAGHILRLGNDRLIKRALAEQHMMARAGGILMDAPKTATLPQLQAMVFENGKKTWKEMVKNLI